MSATIRRASETDLATIADLESAGFEAGQRWSDRSWADELAADNRIVLVGGEPVSAVAAVQHIGEVGELNRIVVDPNHRGRGIGGLLLDAALAAAGAAECSELLLEVREDNTAALKLYDSRGFVVIARRANYYGRGIDALILRREIEETGCLSNR